MSLKVVPMTINFSPSLVLACYPELITQNFNNALIYFILFRCQFHKINANINKNKGKKILHIKSNFINIIDTFTIKLKFQAYYIEYSNT